MRQRLSFYLAALVAFAGCAGGESPQAPSVTEPTQIGAPQAAPPQVPNPLCSPITPLAIQTEIIQLFLKANLDSDRRDVLQGLLGVLGGLAGFAKVQVQVAQGNINGARTTTGLLVKFLTTKFKRLSAAKQLANQAAFRALQIEFDADCVELFDGVETNSVEFRAGIRIDDVQARHARPLTAQGP